jgi:Aspartyl protease
MNQMDVLTVAVMGPQELGNGVDGLIGQDLLAGLTYTIDYRRRELSWGPRTRVASGARLPLEIEDERVLVSLAGGSTRGPLRLVPDGGADGLVLYLARSRSLPFVTPLDTAVLRTVSGPRVVRRALIDSLDLGGFRLRAQTAVLMECAESDPELGDGLLPLHMFARVTFNGPARYLIVEQRD